MGATGAAKVAAKVNVSSWLFFPVHMDMVFRLLLGDYGTPCGRRNAPEEPIRFIKLISINPDHISMRDA
jgi:hypothetical protein